MVTSLPLNMKTQILAYLFYRGIYKAVKKLLVKVRILKADEEIRTLDPLLGKEMLYH